MSDETNSSAAPAAASKSPADAGSSKSGGSAPVAQNGKGDAPRNCFSDKYRSNFDVIDWSR